MNTSNLAANYVTPFGYFNPVMIAANTISNA